jgi:hypothetical protein
MALRSARLTAQIDITRPQAQLQPHITEFFSSRRRSCLFAAAFDRGVLGSLDRETMYIAVVDAKPHGHARS